MSDHNSPSFIDPSILELLIEGANRENSRGSVLPMPPIWVIGAPRSGSTWFGRLLDSNPALFLTEESRVMSYLNRVVRLSADRWLLQYGHKAMIRRLGSDLPGLVERFYRDLGASPTQRWGDKHPHYADSKHDPECLELIDALFPGSQFIHLIRDGRAAAVSFRDLGWGSLEFAAQVWVNHVVHARTFGRALPKGRYLEVRYEDLVESARDVVADAFDYLGVPWHERIDHVLRTQLEREWSQPTRSEGLRSETWRNRLDRDELGTVLSIQGEVLEDFGYQL